MKKTVLQKLIADIKEIQSRGTELTTKGIVTMLENSLEDEKRQIMDALDEGIKYGRDKLANFDYPASRYFYSTFENFSNMESFTQHDWNHMHDCIFHVTRNTTKRKATKEEMQKIFDKLPEDLKGEAFEWGMSDTLWRDKFIEWYEKNKNL